MLINPNDITAKTWVNGELANASDMNTIRDDLRKLRPIGVKHYTTVNGSFINTADTQQAIDDALATGAQDTYLYFPVGEWIMDGTLYLLGADGFIIHGEGHGTSINWVGGGDTGDAPLLYMGGCRFCRIAHMKLQVYSASQPIQYMIVQEQTPIADGIGVSSHNTFDHLRIEGSTVLGHGIYLKGDVTDANNDFATFNRLFIGGYTGSAVLMQGANCLNNYFHNCQLAGQRTGQYGIQSITGAGGQAAHFCVYGGSMLSHLEADVYLATRCGQPVVLDNTWGEGSERLFDMATGQGSMCGVAFRNVQWASDQTSIQGTARPWFIVLGIPGPITMDGCLFGDSNHYSKEIAVRWGYAGNFFAPSFEVRNTRFLGAFDTVAEIFQNTTPTHISNTFAQTSDTTRFELYRNMIPNNFSLAGRNFADSADIPLLKLNASDEIIVGHEQILKLQSTVQQRIEVDCGIRFPATQVSSTNANTFDDYEEGSWNPDVPGTATLFGRYIKAGKMVLASGTVAYSSKGTFSSFAVGDLPFVIGSGAGPAFAVTFGIPINLAAVNIVNWVGQGGEGAAGFSVVATRDTDDGTGGTITDITDADLNDDTILTFTITYEAVT